MVAASQESWRYPRKAKGGCSIVLHGTVLQLSEGFLEAHPGGSEIVTQFAGRDCTREFEEAGHSESALRWALTFAASPAAAAKLRNPESRPLAAKVGTLVDTFGRWIEQIDSKDSSSSGELLPLALAVVTVASGMLAWQLRAAAWR
mmetsp:Transcript_48320/g.103616  ORF Transcript_48320/g.103616 Transcript_48320/m.103616 type:complete len:146 (+) Transcript_48320:153-590(+)